MKIIDTHNHIYPSEIENAVDIINECKKKGHDIRYYDNILDLIKGVYRDVF